MGKELINYEEKFAAEAAEYAEREKTGGTWITARAGTLQIGEDPLPGNQMCVVILDSIRENTYYDQDFDPDFMVPPRCFAFGRQEGDMTPLETMATAMDEEGGDYFEPQAENCAECWANEWGSAEKGRGKACANRRRLVLIPAGYYQKAKGDYDLFLYDDEKEFRTSKEAFLKLPVTSTANFAKYVQYLSAEHRRPPYGVVTRIWIEPDPKTQFKYHFEMIEEIPEELFAVIDKRHEEAKAIIETPYDPPMEDEPPKKAKGRKGLKGLRKGQDEGE